MTEPSKAQRLEQRKGQLIWRSQQLRSAVERDVQALQPMLNRYRWAEARLRQAYPYRWWAAGLLAVLFIRQPKRLWRWGQRAWSWWRWSQRLTRRWQHWQGLLKSWLVDALS